MEEALLVGGGLALVAKVVFGILLLIAPIGIWVTTARTAKTTARLTHIVAQIAAKQGAWEDEPCRRCAKKGETHKMEIKGNKLVCPKCQGFRDL